MQFSLHLEVESTIEVIKLWKAKLVMWLPVIEPSCCICWKSSKRHHNIIEEAPVPNVVNDLCIHLGQDVVPAAKVVGYHNADTVELIADTISGQFYYMEVNPRI